ncbi:hypothetical protein GCM10009839_24340 [Catenulispora yoronensis]|uniref:Thioredoxin-like fold domain-containing protein n=1 Tax=Catenulispora yoronensis TaxID=450799 RepID=A0ABP5FH35_9ACTN
MGAGSDTVSGPAGRTSGSAPASAPGTSGGTGSSGATGSQPAADAAVVLGTGKTSVTIYHDYRCGPCREVHERLDPAVAAALSAGTIKLDVHAVNLIDRNAGGTGSLAAGNAASCAAKAGKFQAYSAQLFAAQPKTEDDDAFAVPSYLIGLAKGVPDLDSPAFESCVRTQPYAASIKSTYDATLGAGKYDGVPTILINGVKWQVPTTGDIAAAFTDAVAKAG